MDPNLIFWPVLLQVATTLAVFVLLGSRKTAAVKAGEVDRRKVALHLDAWPDRVLQVSNNLRNQTETPVLFYVLCVVLWALDAVNAVALGFAWLYAGSRVAHAWVHTTSNYVPMRMRLFLLGLLAIFGLFGAAANALLASAPP